MLGQHKSKKHTNILSSATAEKQGAWYSSRKLQSPHSYLM